MKISKFLFILTLCITALPGFSQEEPVLAVPMAEYNYPAFFIKISPLALMEIPQPSVQVAVEYRLSWPLYLQHELGWLPPMTGQGIFSSGDMQSGMKFKTELRYYLEEEQQPSFLARRTYLAFEGMYRIRIVRNEGWYTMNGLSFSQYLITDQQRQQMAFHFKYGRHVCLSEERNLYVDSYVGIGLRRYFSGFRYITDELAGTPDRDNQQYSYVTPSLTLGFKLGLGIQ